MNLLLEPNGFIFMFAAVAVSVASYLLRKSPLFGTTQVVSASLFVVFLITLVVSWSLELLFIPLDIMFSPGLSDALLWLIASALTLTLIGCFPELVIKMVTAALGSTRTYHQQVSVVTVRWVFGPCALFMGLAAIVNWLL